MLAALVSVFGWRALLRQLAGQRVETRALIKVFCSTQIAKYLPGNVGHHIGRVALARTRLGVPATTTTVSILQEGALVVACSLLVGTACHLVAPLALPAIAGVSASLVLVAMLVAGFGALAIVNRLRAGIGHRAPAWLAFALRIAPAWPAVRRAMPAYIATQLLNGVGVACIASAMIDVDVTKVILLTGAYALAWMIGFLLPGAPGGLGVRESAFLVLVAHALPPEVALGITVLARVGNVAADALVWLAGTLVQSKSPVIERNLDA
jgi:hypothetical protein